MPSAVPYQPGDTGTRVKDLMRPCRTRHQLYKKFVDPKVRVIDDTVVDEETGIVGVTFEVGGVARGDGEAYSLCFHARCAEEFPYALSFACSNLCDPPKGGDFDQPDPCKLPRDWPWWDS